MQSIKTYEERGITAGILLQAANESSSTPPDLNNRLAGGRNYLEPKGDGERTNALTSLCGKYFAEGKSEEEVLAIARGWNCTNTPPLDDDKIVSTVSSMYQTHCRNNPAEQNLIEMINEQHAMVSIAGKVRVLREFNDGNELNYDLMTETDFRKFNASRKKTIAKWIESPFRRTLNKLVFDPAQQPGFCDDSYNTFRGFPVKAVKGDCGLMLDHIKTNIAGGNSEHYDYILAWMADIIQNPSSLPGVALVLMGKQGTGKGIFANAMGSLVSPHYAHVSQASHLTGKFNGHQAQSLVIFADEVNWGGDKQSEGALKALITEPTRMLERKGLDAITVSNYSRVIIASNNSWVVPAGGEERRFLVLNVGDKHMQDHKYFEAITEQLNNGGREAFMYLLTEMDLTKVNLRKLPKTEGLFDQKLRTLSSVPAWWYECLETGCYTPLESRAIAGLDPFDWNQQGAVQAVYEGYENRCRARNIRPEGKSVFGRELKEWVPNLQTTRPSDRGGRARYYQVPPLDECRAYFAEKMGQSITWD